LDGKALGKGCLVAFGILVGIGTCTALLPTGDGPDDEVLVAVACENAVEAQLPSPRSARFPFTMAGSVVVRDDVAQLVSHVDAENAFGAEIRMNFTCTAERTEDGWTATATLLER
jgi:hypothetical protein